MCVCVCVCVCVSIDSFIIYGVRRYIDVKA